ncbi:MAG TPA: hypothetical protein VMP01_23795 [Pirellulaceae bacterium]|nr:hypothetical protein [Pirellulaceae bacterium]
MFRKCAANLFRELGIGTQADGNLPATSAEAKSVAYTCAVALLHDGAGPGQHLQVRRAERQLELVKS